MTRPQRFTTTLIALASAATLASACAGNQEDPCYRSPESCAAKSGSSQYVVTEIQFPETVSESRSIGLDLDGDFEVDNDLGTILPGLRQAAEFDLGKILNDAIATGEVILLVDVSTDDTTSGSDVLGRVLIGKNPSVAPCANEDDTTCGLHLTPGTAFQVDTDAIFDAAVLGDISDSTFEGGPNAIKIEIDLEEIANVPAFLLDGEGVRASVRHTATGLEGMLGGGVRAEQIENAVLPALIETAHETCRPHESPDVCCVPGSIGAELIAQFDSGDKDCRLTQSELMDSTLVSSMLAPTLDLLSSDQFEPGGDGELDTMSIGARFEAIPASF